MYPPSGKTIRELYDKAERSAFTTTGVSNFDRYKREIQSVTTSEAVAVDHTFAVVKNYNVQGAKACFTMLTSTKQIATAALVETTSVNEISHLCEQIVRRRINFQPKVIYTDTWPHNDEFWKDVFGFCVIGRLGLFHCMKRIADTLNPRCLYYWEALWDLKACFYQYNADDMDALMVAMSSGTFKSDGTAMKTEEIRQLRESKEWKSRADPYLRKNLHKKETVIQNLSSWLMKWKNKSDANDQELCPNYRSPCPDFCPNYRPQKKNPTEKAIQEQKNKVQYVADVPQFNPYRKLLPGPKSKHQLPTYVSARPESHLEGFHKIFAHFANTGMKRELADTLTLGGMADNNVDVRHRLQRSNTEYVHQYGAPPPQHHDTHAVFRNHLLLEHLNKMAVGKGLETPFFNITTTNDDNGEVFLSEYFDQQKNRNEANTAINTRTNTGAKRCNCLQCARNSIPYLYELSNEDASEMILQGTATTNINNMQTTNNNYQPRLLPSPPSMLRSPPLQLPSPPPLPTQFRSPPLPSNMPIAMQPQVYLPYQLPPAPTPTWRYRIVAPNQYAYCDCVKVKQYQLKRAMGSVRGRPPKHDPCCMFRIQEL